MNGGRSIPRLLKDLEQVLQAPGDYELALDANSANPSRVHSVCLKLSDLFFKMGDVENERYYREAVCSICHRTPLIPIPINSQAMGVLMMTI